MNMEKRSGYANYLNLSDKSGTRLKCNFTAYQEFKIIKEVINSIAFSDKNTYLYNGNIYNRKITSQEAKNILANTAKDNIPIPNPNNRPGHNIPSNAINPNLVASI